MNVLVAFATKSGSTAGIAQAIGEELKQMGLEVDVRNVDEVGDVSKYGALILGSAIYNGRWRKEALRFGSRHEGELRGRPVWLFDSGPTDRSADEGKAVPVKAATELAHEIGARGHVTFGGKFGPENVGRLTRRLIEMGGEGSFGDFRNFERIRAWARSISTELQAIQLAKA